MQVVSADVCLRETARCRSQHPDIVQQSVDEQAQCETERHQWDSLAVNWIMAVHGNRDTRQARVVGPRCPVSRIRRGQPLREVNHSTNHPLPPSLLISFPPYRPVDSTSTQCVLCSVGHSSTINRRSSIGMVDRLPVNDEPPSKTAPSDRTESSLCGFVQSALGRR